MTEITYREAVIRALHEELERDERVVLIGEDVGAAGGVFKATAGLFERFGPDRVRDTPISEQAIIGCALGAAVTGLRPVAEIMFADFAGVCFDQLANQAAKYRYMSAGQATAPLTIRMANGGGVGFGAQHSQTVENWFLNVPGVLICVPATPADVRAQLKLAIRDENPAIVFEHKALYNQRGPVPANGALTPLGVAERVREGTDVTVVASQLMRMRALEAAERLAQEDISVELIDPRTLVPLDLESVVASVRKTSRLACVQESSVAGSWGATLAALVTNEAFEYLDAPPLLLSADPTPLPYAAALESAALPSAVGIAQSLRRLVLSSAA